MNTYAIRSALVAFLSASMVLWVIGTIPPTAHAGDLDKIAKGGIKIITAPTRAATAAVKGESVSDELKETEHAVKDGIEATGNVATKAVNALGGAGGTKPVPGSTDPNRPSPTASSMGPATVVAVAIVLWAMLDPDSFCEVFSGGGSCNVNTGINVNQNGEVSTPGSEGYRPPTEAEQQQALDHDLLGFIQKQFLPEWEREMWEVKFVINGTLIPAYYPNTGVTWMAELPGNVTASGELREEKDGSPLMGARRLRDTSYGLHKGTDYATKPGDQIYAAFDGPVTFAPNVHKGFGLVTVTASSGHRQENLYVKQLPDKKYDGTWVARRGEPIGIAEDLHRPDGYKPETPNHVHTNFKSPEGVYLGPQNNWAVTNDADWIANHCRDSACISFNNKNEPVIPAPMVGPK